VFADSPHTAGRAPEGERPTSAPSTEFARVMNTTKREEEPCDAHGDARLGSEGAL